MSESDSIEGMTEQAGAKEVEALRARIAVLESHALKLYGWLDDIDTLDDVCKSNDGMFRRMALPYTYLRHKVATTDGYSVVFNAEPKP